ncbi:hypothetical protein L1887_09704 [Cichorium endivia]|nr:hypothetical protein L1887_09704 [Cichorium endivia]
MEELSKMAMAYYQASSDHLQELARNFFGTMDHDGDGKIDRREFLEFMRDEVKSGRPFCDHCKKFIASTYLTCVGCLEDPIGGSFYLCLDCYIMQKCDHTHNGLCRFLDNYSLLEAMTKSKLNELRSFEAKSRPMETNSIPGKPPMSNDHTWDPSLAMVPVPNRPPPIHNYHSWSQGGPSVPPVQNHTWIQNNYPYHYPPPPPVPNAGAPNAIVPQRQRWTAALVALNAALQIGAVGSTFCSIL